MKLLFFSYLLDGMVTVFHAPFIMTCLYCMAPMIQRAAAACSLRSVLIEEARAL